MEWVDSLRDVNFLAVIGAVVASFAVGMAWYSKMLFGKQWMKELDLTDKDVENKDGMVEAMMRSAVATFITAAGLGAVMVATSTEGVIDGAAFGAITGFVFATASMVTHDAFSKHSGTLTMINGTHDIVKFAVMGALLGA